ncbi:MAG TPA: hypothetical protein VFW94_14275 [Candidatus Acidoferrales bacterium]|nr:hypothetical protein [Candidatus Acidoferrales bacterium]
MRRLVHFGTGNGAHRIAAVAAALLVALMLGACTHTHAADTQPLDSSGMSYTAVKQLDGMNVTRAEIPEILKAYNAGFTDEDCVQIVQLYHGRGQAFKSGDAVAGLIQSGLDGEMILSLAKLNQLGSTYGEYEAMHLAGLSDSIILAVAQKRDDNKPVLSGASLAGLKNTGLRGSTLLELARRGVPDTEAHAIISFRRRGASDSQILRRFSGS